MPFQALVVNLVDQRPKQSETHSSTFPQDSDSDSESEIELRSTHTSPETTTCDESDGTLVDSSTSATPTPPLSGEGDLDSTKGHSQLSVGTLPLTDKDPPEKPQEKDPPPSSSESEGPNPTSSKDTSDNLPSPRNKETVTTPPPEELEHVVGTPPSPHRQDSLPNTLQKKTQKPLLILRKAWAYLPLRNHRVFLQITHSLASGQDKQLMHQTKTKRDIGGWLEN